MSRPSPTLRLAQALASQCRDAYARRDVASRKEVRDTWRSLKPATRRWWLRTARRVLSRWQVLGPPGN